MQVDLLAHYSNLPVDELERLFTLSPEEVYDDPAYKSWITTLDQGLLNATLKEAREAYEVGLPAIRDKYGLSNSTMSGHTLCNWVIGFLMYPERVRDMLERHKNISSQTISQALPEVVALLEAMPSPEGRAEWGRALVIFSVPLLDRENI